MPPTRLPPTLGGASWYWTCSRSLTTQPSSWCRAHSATRAAVLSVPGAIRAPPIDQASHTRKTTVTAPARRTQDGRRFGRDAPCRGGRLRGSAYGRLVRVMLASMVRVAYEGPMNQGGRQIHRRFIERLPGFVQQSANGPGMEERSHGSRTPALRGDRRSGGAVASPVPSGPIPSATAAAASGGQERGGRSSAPEQPGASGQPGPADSGGNVNQ